MREYLITLMVAAAVTYIVTPVVRRFAVRIGAMTKVRDRDVHTIPTPRLGGAAMFIGMAAALLVASRMPTLQVVNQRFSEPRAMLIGGGVLGFLPLPVVAVWMLPVGLALLAHDIPTMRRPMARLLHFTNRRIEKWKS